MAKLTALQVFNAVARNCGENVVTGLTSLSGLQLLIWDKITEAIQDICTDENTRLQFLEKTGTIPLSIGNNQYKISTLAKGSDLMVEDIKSFRQVNSSNNIQYLTPQEWDAKYPSGIKPDSLFTNGDFEVWDSGVPDDWTKDYGTVAQAGNFSVKITGDSSDGAGGYQGYIYQAIHSALGIAYWQGRTVTAGCWVKASVADRARLQISDGATAAYSSYHTGNGGWQWLTVTETLASDATVCNIYLMVSGATTVSAYFHGALAVEGSSLSILNSGYPTEYSKFEGYFVFNKEATVEQDGQTIKFRYWKLPSYYDTATPTGTTDIPEPFDRILLVALATLKVLAYLGNTDEIAIYKVQVFGNGSDIEGSMDKMKRIYSSPILKPRMTYTF